MPSHNGRVRKRNTIKKVSYLFFPRLWETGYVETALSNSVQPITPSQHRIFALTLADLYTGPYTDNLDNFLESQALVLVSSFC